MISSSRLAVILVLYQALCSIFISAFTPTSSISRTQERNARLSVLSVASKTTSPDSVVSKPYFADFSTKNILADANCNTVNQIGQGKTAIVAGSTGYIGRACVRECVARGYNTIALVRDVTRASTDEALSGASLVECDVTNENELQSLFKEIASASGKHCHISDTRTNPLPVDMVISCLASPSGIESEVFAIDYQATLNLLNAGDVILLLEQDTLYY